MERLDPSLLQGQTNSDWTMLEFYEFLASDRPNAEKADLIADHWRDFCDTEEDVHIVFLSFDIMTYLQDTTAATKQMIRFLCFSIMRSTSIRDYVIQVLLYEAGIFTRYENLDVQDVLMILTACSLTILSGGEMRRILDYLLSQPPEFDLEALVTVMRVSQSLDFVGRKHSVRLVNFMNRIAMRFLQGHIMIDDSHIDEFGSVVTSVAMRIAHRISDLSCFDLRLWRPFLAAINRLYELPDVCHCPLTIDEPSDLPYKQKLRLYGFNCEL